MIYRKAPVHPPRLLLRVVRTASASALVGLGACSSASSAKMVPETPQSTDDGGDVAERCAPDAADRDNCFNGSVAYYPDAADDGFPADATTVVTGIAPYAGDAASDAETVIHGIGPYHPPDASDEAGLPCGTGVCGSIVMPPDGG